MKKVAATAVGTALALAANVSVAGGTLGTNELIPLMKQQPRVYEALISSFEFRDSAWASIRFGHFFPRLTGTRAGPYEIEAKVKATGQGIGIVLCTSITYLDESGRTLPTSAEESAVAIQETLTAVLLEQSVEDREPACP